MDNRSIGTNQFRVIARRHEQATRITPIRTVTVTACGNGIINPLGDDNIISSDDEKCDDDNFNDTDSCSQYYKIEAGYNCTREPGVCSIL